MHLCNSFDFSKIQANISIFKFYLFKLVVSVIEIKKIFFGKINLGILPDGSGEIPRLVGGFNLNAGVSPHQIFRF